MKGVKNQMELVKKTKIRHLNLHSDRRIIFMSDIHGDINLFKKALNDLNFSDMDYLFIIGDMIEKGDLGDNLKMLDYVMELDKLDNVYLMAGNCDEVFRTLYSSIDKERFLFYALEKKKSVINDFAFKI